MKASTINPILANTDRSAPRMMKISPNLSEITFWCRPKFPQPEVNRLTINMQVAVRHTTQSSQLGKSAFQPNKWNPTYPTHTKTVAEILTKPNWSSTPTWCKLFRSAYAIPYSSYVDAICRLSENPSLWNHWVQVLQNDKSTVIPAITPCGLYHQTAYRTTAHQTCQSVLISINVTGTPYTFRPNAPIKSHNIWKQINILAI